MAINPIFPGGQAGGGFTNPLGADNLPPELRQSLIRSTARQAENTRSQAQLKFANQVENDAKQKGGQNIQQMFKGFGGN